MKIAIALFGTRVSPRFDCAPVLRVVETDNGEILNIREISLEECNVMDRIKKLEELGIDALICGGIDVFSSGRLNFSRMKVYSWITGGADDALSCLLKGQLESGFMMAPGGRCCGRWRFRGGRGGGRGRGFRGLPPNNW